MRLRQREGMSREVIDRAIASHADTGTLYEQSCEDTTACAPLGVLRMGFTGRSQKARSRASPRLRLGHEDPRAKPVLSGQTLMSAQGDHQRSPLQFHPD